VRDEGGLLAATLRDTSDLQLTSDQAPSYGSLVAKGPRAQRERATYELLVETIREGYLLHYAQGRIVATNDRDLALLAGDRLYALGIEWLAELGDLQAVCELADVIALSAIAQNNHEEALADAVWHAGALAVGWGTNAAHAGAKQLVRDNNPEACAALNQYIEEAEKSL
jgi:hypothetical protein